MKKNLFSYFITPFGVISFTPKYVFINGLKTKSSYRLRVILQKFDSEMFSNWNLFMYGCFDYFDHRGVLLRYLRSNKVKHDVVEVFSSDVHKASDIFQGQCCVYPSVDNDLPF